jgi:primosomal protein N' (replication factor Y)
VTDWRNDGALGLLPDMPLIEEISPPKDDKPEKSPSRGKKSKDARTLRPAADKPIARIAVDMSLPHLDRPFDYLVPERLAGQARPGVRVRVRFAGVLTDGFLVERADESEHLGSLRYLERVLSTERVLTEEIAGLARSTRKPSVSTPANLTRTRTPGRAWPASRSGTR